MLGIELRLQRAHVEIALGAGSLQALRELLLFAIQPSLSLGDLVDQQLRAANRLVEVGAQAQDLGLPASQLSLEIVEVLCVLIELILACPLQSRDLVTTGLEILAAALQVVLANVEVTAQERDVLLLCSNDFDELFLIDELLEQHRIEGCAMLLVLLDEEIARVGQAPHQVVDLHLQALDLDLLLVQLVIDTAELALANPPDLGEARHLRLERRLSSSRRICSLPSGVASSSRLTGARRGSVARFRQQLGLAIRN